jgi:hypothetical protein
MRASTRRIRRQRSVAGVRWLTLRSDGFDKYAQPLGTWSDRRRWRPEHRRDGPRSPGRENIVIADADHREVAFGPRAFDAMYRFLTGPHGAPRRRRRAGIVLDGVVSGFCDGSATNLPLVAPIVSVT